MASLTMSVLPLGPDAPPRSERAALGSDRCSGPKGVDLAHTSQLERRLKANFDMAHTWDHQVLFHGDFAWAQEDAGSTETVGLNITCIDCETKGSITAKLWEDLLHPSLRLQFNGVEAYVFLGLNASASTTVSVNLFASNSPIGLHYPGLSVGVVFFVDLVFSLNATIDMSGGFYIKLADDAFLQADIFGGDVSDYFFDGASSKSLPITVETGSGATFKADLRLRVQVGAEAAIDTFGIGAGAAMGIYANLVEFVAEIEKTPTCDLETREWFDLNAGAYAKLDVVVDYKTLGLVPTVSTTLLSAPTLTQCWIPHKASGIAGPGLTMTSPALSATIPALPFISSSMPANQSSKVTVSGLSHTVSSATIPTSTVSQAALSSLSSLSSTDSITAKYATSATVLSPLSSAMPSLAPPLSLNGTGRYPMVHSSQVTVSGSQAAASSSSSSSLSSLSASLSLAASSRSTSSLPPAASFTAKSSGFSTTITPPLSTAAPSGALSPLSLNGTGRYPMVNASALGATNETNLVTTTLYSTAAYTITMCAAGVPNCPAAYQQEVTVTKTVDSFTTICPAGAQVTWPAAAEVSGEAGSPSAAASSSTTSQRVVVTQVVALTKVPSPKPETFVPPPVPAPTKQAIAVAAVAVASGEGSNSGAAAAGPRPAAAAAYAAFMADYGVDNAKAHGDATSTTPSSSGSASSSVDHGDYPVVAAAVGASNEPVDETSPLTTPSSSDQLDHPVVAAADGSSLPADENSPLTSFGHESIVQNSTTTSSSSGEHVPVTAGAVASYAGNIGLVLGSIVVTVILMG
ncbi:hypothetical protein PG997_015397 [Apiospora hydei]|uniref:Uncharacterized protein n=1 Tax=Apiospora hydei TaxID=1337664 RepID=A0ABR1UT03_9PEZI